jgi:hypothetical protein
MAKGAWAGTLKDSFGTAAIAEGTVVRVAACGVLVAVAAVP